jgi:hypothetical protein
VGIHAKTIELKDAVAGFAQLTSKEDTAAMRAASIIAAMLKSYQDASTTRTVQPARVSERTCRIPSRW